MSFGKVLANAVNCIMGPSEQDTRESRRSTTRNILHRVLVSKANRNRGPETGP